MGWFWDSPSNPTPEAATADAYRNLDPSLRDFLDKQTPSDHNAAQPKSTPKDQTPPPPNSEQTPYRAQIGLNAPGLTLEQQNAPPSASPAAAVPQESLYQDGRYAHLWKTYRSEAQLNAESRSDQDKLAGVLETIKDRKAAIGRAAVENCVEEQMAERECYRSGPWKDRLLMCRAQNRAFNRCYSMQSRFLRALGYLSSQYTTPEDEEKIQMHADKLYHEMLEREREMEDARAAGKDVASVQVVIPSDTTTQALGEESAWAKARRRAQADGTPSRLDHFSVEKQKEVKERLRNLTESEREVELQLLAAESRAMQEYTEQIEKELLEEKKLREERRDRGRETVGDSVKRIWGFGSR